MSDANNRENTNRFFFTARKSITYAMFGGFREDCLINKQSEIDSPTQNGIFDHVHTRVVGPFSQKFELSLKNQYFFRPIRFEFETTESVDSTFDSVMDQICSVLFPILSFIDPLEVFARGQMLALLHLANSLLSFCNAMYLFSKETLNGHRDYSKAVDNLKQTASNFLIGLCMPVVGTAASILDCVRLVTRCVATLVNLVQKNSMDSPAAPVLC